MSEVSGVLQDVIKRSVAGGKTAYDIVVAGEKYGAGFFAPKAKVGDFVTFNSSTNGNFKNVERGSLKVSEYKGEPEKTPATKTGVKAAVSNFDARQDAISRQAASNTAIAWVTFLASQDAISGASKTKGAKQDYLDTLREKYEVIFYERNTGNEWKDISPHPTTAEESAEEEEAGQPEDAPWE